MKNFPSLSPAFVLASCLPLVSAHAQSRAPAPIEQARQRSSMFDFQQEIPVDSGDELAEAEESEEAVETPGDLDLGVQLIMKPKERDRPLRLFATLTEFYTNNAGLAKYDPESDTYLFAEIGARYETQLSETLHFEATVRQAIFRYGKLDGLDFESLNIGAGVGYKLPEFADVTLFTRYNYEHLTRDDFGNGFFSNQTLSFGAQKSWVYQEKSLFYVGYASIFGFAKPVSAERAEHGVFGGAHVRLTERLDCDVYGRLAFFNFQSGQRDFNQMIVPSLTYRFSPQCELNASFSFVLNDSNRSSFDYDALTVGGGLTFNLRF
jgi:hypothetical protein